MSTQEKGFTLMELLITIAVVGILAGVAVPSFSQMLADARIDRVQNDIVQTLNFARNAALTRKQVVKICGITPGQTDVCNDQSSWNNGWMVVAQTSSGDQVLFKMPMTPGAFKVSMNRSVSWPTSDMRSLAFAPATTSVNTGAVGWDVVGVCDSRGADYARWVVVEGVTSRGSSGGQDPLPQGGAIYKSSSPGQLWNSTKMSCGV